jgi:hypothetical protein
MLNVTTRHSVTSLNPYIFVSKNINNTVEQTDWEFSLSENSCMQARLKNFIPFQAFKHNFGGRIDIG